MNELYEKLQTNIRLMHELKISNREIQNFLLLELYKKNIIIREQRELCHSFSIERLSFSQNEKEKKEYKKKISKL
jgi:GTPase Era involved in 16S rRNA processing